jgi:L-ascorbate metabolism protein UlaG (beta-lactamase superfamily)
MVITHYSGQCFKVQFGDVSIVFDPISKASKNLDASKFGVDIALVSRKHPDFNGIAEVTYGEKVPFVVNGPGEYEYNGVTIQGFPTKSTYDIEKGTGSAINTMYVVKLEGMTLVFLGALSDATLPLEAREALDTIDMLFLPIGGGEVLDVSQAEKLCVLLEPHIIIPMHYKGIGDKGSLESFAKEGGRTLEKTDKLTIKKKEVNEKDGIIIAITP